MLASAAAKAVNRGHGAVLCLPPFSVPFSLITSAVCRLPSPSSPFPPLSSHFPLLTLVLCPSCFLLPSPLSFPPYSAGGTRPESDSIQIDSYSSGLPLCFGSTMCCLLLCILVCALAVPVTHHPLNVCLCLPCASDPVECILHLRGKDLCGRACCLHVTCGCAHDG